jgi:hypothetical protein
MRGQEEEGGRLAAFVHPAHDGVGVDPAEDVDDGKLVVDHRGGGGAAVLDHAQPGAGAAGGEKRADEAEGCRRARQAGEAERRARRSGTRPGFRR